MSKYLYYIFVMLFVLHFAGCNNFNSEKTENTTAKTNSVMDECITSARDNDIIYIEKVKDISEFDLEFVQKVFAQENVFLKNGSYYLEKLFLLTKIINKNNEFFFYKVLFKNGEGDFPNLLKKLSSDNYIVIRPEMKAPHTCYLFKDEEQYFIIGFYGLIIIDEDLDDERHSEQFDIEDFIRYVKKNVTGLSSKF